MGTVKIEILRNCICEQRHVSAGDVVEVSEKTAQVLVNIGKAKLVEAES